MKKQSGSSTIGVVLFIAFIAYCWLSMLKDGSQIKVSSKIQCENKSGMLALTYDLRNKLEPTIGCAGEPDAEGDTKIIWSDGKVTQYSEYNLNREKTLVLILNGVGLIDFTGGSRTFGVSDIPCLDKRSFLTFLIDNKNNEAIEAGCSTIDSEKTVNTTMFNSGNFSGYLNPEVKHELYKFNFH